VGKTALGLVVDVMLGDAVLETAAGWTLVGAGPAALPPVVALPQALRANVISAVITVARNFVIFSDMGSVSFSTHWYLLHIRAAPQGWVPRDMMVGS
jgi:hypothetical protein